ncbi:unnamed protein product [Triticum turgidum subsp. durum]|uniref:Transmembrane protein n=1 Tax=Triticum turgidum subsp. durum TaxID=4567 RepID=A0A9R0TKC6_TRITD|nr:unnamed protein product [Triticum turgidum subsp. durum]
MESPQKKAGSMDGTGSEKTPLPHLLPVTVAKKTPRPNVVREVSEWVLVTAFSFAFALVFSFGLAYALELFHVQCSQSSLFLRCGLLTDAEEAVMNALGIGMLCCVALQAAAAALALRLQCRRRWVRRALAYLALALTIGGHCFYAALSRLFLVADPGDLFFRICSTVGIFVCAAGDTISFLALILGRE